MFEGEEDDLWCDDFFIFSFRFLLSSGCLFSVCAPCRGRPGFLKCLKCHKASPQNIFLMTCEVKNLRDKIPEARAKIVFQYCICSMTNAPQMTQGTNFFYRVNFLTCRSYFSNIWIVESGSLSYTDSKGATKSVSGW